MRLWSLHPKYLDPQGLVALWREGLLAQAVLRGRTKGYRHHPQLRRFQRHATPRSAINVYLDAVLSEADARGYNFDRRKIPHHRSAIRLKTTRGQLAYEWAHLMKKLRRRNPAVHWKWKDVRSPEPHPMFRVLPGRVEHWERTRL